MATNEAHFRDSPRYKLVYRQLIERFARTGKSPSSYGTAALLALLQKCSQLVAGVPTFAVAWQPSVLGTTQPAVTDAISSRANTFLWRCALAIAELVRVYYLRVDAYRDDSEARSGSQRSPRVVEVTPGHSGQGWAETWLGGGGSWEGHSRF